MLRKKSSAFHWMHRVSATTVAMLGLALSARAQVMPRITTQVKDSALVTLRGNTIPVANALNDRGRVADETPTGRLMLVLKHSDEQQAALDTLIAAQMSPGSANFHKWLTPAQYASQFGVSDADIQTVTAYLSGQGFNVAQVLPNKQAIEFSGTAGQVRSTFKTELHTFAAGSRTFTANDRDPQIPAALAPVVKGFASLNNYRSVVQAASAAKSNTPTQHTKAHPLYDNFPPNGTVLDDTLDLSPGDIAAIYDIPAAANGAGVSIGVISSSNVNITYLNNYQKTFKLPVKNPTIVVDGNDPGENFNAFDALTQLELLSAVAPSANLYLYTTTSVDGTDGLNYAIIRAVNDNKVQVIVYDTESCEANLGVDGNAFINFTAEQAAAQGITMIAGTGNGGSDSCQAVSAFGNSSALTAVTSGLSVNGYATSPFVTAVGATDFHYPPPYPDPAIALDYWNSTNAGTAGYTSAKGYIPEQPFNYSTSDTNYYGSYGVALATGGGISTLGLGTTGYPTPSWQIPVLSKSSDPEIAAVAKKGTGRVIPDISIFGGGGGNGSSYMLCLQADECVNATPGNITYETFSGPNTSSATFAGIAALVIQSHGVQGNIDPTLYSLYQTGGPSGNPASIFHAPVAGNNTVACVAGTPDCGAGGYLVESAGGPVAYEATTSGFNAAVGLGSVNVANLITDWVSPATTLTTTTFTLTQLGKTTAVTKFVHGAALQETIKVASGTGTPTGDVGILTTSALPSNTGITYGTLAGGVFTDTSRSSDLPGGTYQLYARYAGDGVKFAPSVSTPFTVTVTPESSHVELTPSVATGSKISYGSSFSVSAYVGSATNGSSYGEPTGSLTVTDANSTGVTQTSYLPIDSTNRAHFDTPLAVGTHTLTFHYPGDPSYQASSATMSLTVTVGSQITATALNSTSSNDPKNGYVQLVAVVSAVGGSTGGVGPLGTVTFTSAGSTVKVLGTATLVAGSNASGIVAGVANFQLGGSKIPAGTTGIIATYNPIVNSNFSTSTSAPLSLTTATTGGTAASTTALATADGFASYFDYTGSLSFNVTVTGAGATPGGSVALFSNGVSLGSVTLAGGKGTLTLASDPKTGLLPVAFAVGKDVITAQYSGDSTYSTSTKALTISILSEGTLPDFALVSNTNYGILSATSTSAAFTLQLTSINNFAAQGYNVSFSAAAPAGITCTFGGTPLKFASTATNLTNTVTCTGASGYTVAHADPAQAPLRHFWIASGGAAFACVFLLGMPARRRNWRGMLGAIVLGVLALGAAGSLTACGGNSMGSGTSSLDGTSNAKAGTSAATKTLVAGNYQVLITVKSAFTTKLNTASTSSVQTHTIPLEITVQ